MLCRRNQDTFFLQAGGVAYFGHIAADGFNFKAIKIAAAENNARSRYGRKDPEGHRSATMQAYARAFDGGSNCLFKWQVIPSKQITPNRGSPYVVFLPQTVSTWELLCFNRINLGHGRVKEGF